MEIPREWIGVSCSSTEELTYLTYAACGSPETMSWFIHAMGVHAEVLLFAAVRTKRCMQAHLARTDTEKTSVITVLVKRG